MRIVRARRLDGRRVELQDFDDLIMVAEALNKKLIVLVEAKMALPYFVVLDCGATYVYRPRPGDVHRIPDLLRSVHRAVVECTRAGLETSAERPEPYSMGGLWLEDTWRVAEEALRTEVDVYGRPVRVVIQPEPEGPDTLHHWEVRVEPLEWSDEEGWVPARPRKEGEGREAT